MKIYLSYVFEDFIYFRVENMVYILENNKIAEKVYFWERDNIPGVPFLNYMETEIYNSDIVLMLFSTNSKNSSYFNQELEMALSTQKKIVPVYDVYENLPYNLSGRKSFQFDEVEYYGFLKRLCQYLSGLIYDDEFDNFSKIQSQRKDKINLQINNNNNYNHYYTDRNSRY